MELNQIYNALAKNLENGLNSMSEITKFEIKTSYNYQEPSKGLSLIKGVMNFTTNDVAPIENLDAYTLPAIVSLFCKKEYANEVMAIVTQYVATVRGRVQTAGDYFTLPTYTTPSQSEIQMIGELGESIKIMFFIEYAVYKNLIFSNDMTVKIDEEPLFFNEFGISKQKACDSDNLNNRLTLQSIANAQSLSFSFSAFITTNMSFLLDEILSLVELEKKHTLAVTISGNTKTYTVIMDNSEIKGAIGGAMYASLNFIIADGSGGER